MNKHWIHGSALAAALTLLGGCGGGGGSGGDAPPAAGPGDVVPAEASQSPAALKKVVGDLVAAPSEAREPLELTGFTPPLADDAEPEPLG